MNPKNPYKKGDRVIARNTDLQRGDNPRRGTVFSDPIQDHGITVVWDGCNVLGFIRISHVRRESAQPGRGLSFSVSPAARAATSRANFTAGVSNA